MKKILIIVSFWLLLASCSSTKPYANLTACLEKNQVVMFGASWCPVCSGQKKLFGKSAKDMPYFECAIGATQAPECKDRRIESYPTWQFPDAVLRKLPEEALANIFNGEIAKVRSTTASYQEAVKDQRPELLAQIEAFRQKTENLATSSLPGYEKLVKLTVLTDSPEGALIERPVYTSGRIAGQRPLSEIALYSGCSAEYQADTTAQK